MIATMPPVSSYPAPLSPRRPLGVDERLSAGVRVSDHAGLAPADVFTRTVTNAAATAPQTYMLSNGAVTHLLQSPHQQQSAIRLMLPVSPALSGTQGLLSQIIIDGSDATRFRLNHLRNQGISLNIGFTADKLILVASGPVGQEADMVQAALDMFSRPVVTPADFERIRLNESRELQNLLSESRTPLQTATQRALYGYKQPYSLSPSDIIHAIVRQNLPNLLNLHQQMLQPSSATPLMMISPLPPTQQFMILNQASQQVGWARKGLPLLPHHPLSSAIHPGISRKPVVLVPNHNLQRALVQMNWQAPRPGDPDFIAFRLLQHILGGQLEGSFFKTLRTEHGLVYSVSAGTGARLGNGLGYSVDLEVDFDKIELAKNDLRQVTQQLAAQPVSADVLTMAKRSFLLSMRDQAQTAPRSLNFYEPWLKENLPPPSFSALQAAMERVTAADIQRVAYRMFNAPQRVELLGISAPAQVLAQFSRR